MAWKHFLITRFNLCMYPTSSKKWSDAIMKKSKMVHLDDDYLLGRLEMFNTYTVPSVRGQTTQDFTWLILMDDRTSARIVGKIIDIAKGRKDTYLLQGREPDYYLSASGMVTLLEDDTKWVISTSLDNDDALSKEYMQVVQDNFREKREFINLTKGVTVAHHKGFQYIGNREGRTVNHFRSFVEPSDNIASVYTISHGSSESLAPVKHVESPARWLEVIHGDNCSNRFKKKTKDKTRPLEELAEDFSLDPRKIKNYFKIDRKGFVIDPSWGRPL